MLTSINYVKFAGRCVSVASVHSRLDYGSGLLVGIPACLMRRLQSVLKAATRMIVHLRLSDHITDALISLHWLRVPERIEYKIAVLTFRVLHGSAPSYLGPVTPHADQPGRRVLRCSDTNDYSCLPTDCLPLAADPFRWLLYSHL